MDQGSSAGDSVQRSLTLLPRLECSGVIAAQQPRPPGFKHLSLQSNWDHRHMESLLPKLECNGTISAHCTFTSLVQAILLPQPPKQSLALVAQPGSISAHCNLHLLGLINSPAFDSQIAGMIHTCHHAWLLCVFVVETGLHHVGRAGLKLLISGDPPCLSLPLCGDRRCEPPHPAKILHLDAPRDHLHVQQEPVQLLHLHGSAGLDLPQALRLFSKLAFRFLVEPRLISKDWTVYLSSVNVISAALIFVECMLQLSDIDVISDLAEPMDVAFHRLVISSKMGIVDLQNDLEIVHNICKDLSSQVLNGLETPDHPCGQAPGPQVSLEAGGAGHEDPGTTALVPAQTLATADWLGTVAEQLDRAQRPVVGGEGGARDVKIQRQLLLQMTHRWSMRSFPMEGE
ncbi:hypothetical protein AAY473_037871, partial [Plecturocebus cupreus]